MRSQVVSLTTVLPVKALGALFEEVTSARQGIGGKIGGFVRNQRLEFFRPKNDSPFSALDDDQPVFTVGVNIPRATKLAGGETTVHLYAWDDGNSRRAQFYSPHTIGGTSMSRKIVDDLAAAVKAMDETAILG
jgi:hypothetical protein